MDNKENNSKHLQPDEKVNQDSRKLTKPPEEIRCYGRAGFLVPIKQPDGTIKKVFFYGREGD